MDKSKILTILAMIFTILSIIGWAIFVGGFGHTTDVLGVDRFQGHVFTPHWIVVVVSPVLITIMFVKGICMLINANLFRKMFIIPILSVVVIIVLVFLVAFLGTVLHVSALTIATSLSSADNNALFSGAFLEIIFLGVAEMFFLLAYQFQGKQKSSSVDVVNE